MANPAEVKAARIQSARERLQHQRQEDIDDEFLKRVTIKGFRATQQMIDYAKAYVCSLPVDSFKDIAARAGVNDRTIRRWREQPAFREWITQVSLAATGTSVALVWQAVAERATAGDMQAAKMIATRFDPDYQQPRVAHGAPFKRGVPDDAELEATRATLRSAEDAPIDDVGPVCETGAGEAPQAQAPHEEAAEEKGAGGE